MARWKAVLLAAALILLPSLVPAATFEVTASRANLRAGPGATFDIIGNLAQGEKFEVTGSQGEWVKILWLNREGWVHRSLGRVAGAGPEFGGKRIYGRSWALVVGINRYADARIPPLRHAEHDAGVVERELRRHGFEVRKLLGREATWAAIQNLLDDLNPRMVREDRLLIYYAGHGVTAEVKGAVGGYLLPFDAQVRSWPTFEEKYMRVAPGRALEMNLFMEKARQLNPKHILISVDACFAGFATASRDIGVAEVDERTLARWSREPVVNVLTAGDAGQRAVEVDRYGMGLFSYYFVRGLQGNADLTKGKADGLVTFAELANYVASRLRGEPEARDFPQTPLVGYRGDGQFLFPLPPPGEAEVAVSPPERPAPVTPPTLAEVLQGLDDAEKAIARLAPVTPPTPPEPPVTAALGRGDLYVASEPPGASIFVDGRDTGKKTPELVAGLAAGKHKLLIRKGEEWGTFQDVEVRPRELVNLSLRLERLQGELYAKVRPFGAEVLVDGRKFGETPVKRKVPAGEREVEVKKEGYYPLKQKVFVKFGETAELEASLRAIPTGTLVIESAPPGATIVIEGKEMGTTPRALRLYAQPHTLLLKKPGFKDVASSVLVAEGKTSRVTYILPEDPGPPLAEVPAGWFLMGSNEYDGEKPQRRVYLDAFRIDKYPVTNEWYGRFMRATGRGAPVYWTNARLNAPSQPVVGVNWEDARSFCAWLGRRLPTEAEWEKAARGPEGWKYPWGNEWDPNRAIFEGNSGAKTHPVDRTYNTHASPYGLVDMAGNVWQWVADWYDENYYKRALDRNPKGPESGQWRVLRGGSWLYGPRDLRAAVRGRFNPGSGGGASGFRCARAPG